MDYSERTKRGLHVVWGFQTTFDCSRESLSLFSCSARHKENGYRVIYESASLVIFTHRPDIYSNPTAYSLSLAISCTHFCTGRQARRFAYNSGRVRNSFHDFRCEHTPKCAKLEGLCNNKIILKQTDPQSYTSTGPSMFWLLAGLRWLS